MKYRVGLCLLLLISFISSFNTVRAELLPGELKDLETYVNQLMEEWKAPGVAVGIVKDNKLIYKKGFGYTGIDKKQKVTPETIFAIGSNTKSFTGTVLGILVDEGKLDWDKPVKEYMPSFSLSDEYASNHSTIVDLLSHRTGLPTHDALISNTKLSRAEIMTHIPYLDMNKELREAWQYNNLMYLASGCLVEELSGKTWEEYVQDVIFTPLDMTSSNFSVYTTQKQSDNYALPYQVKYGKVKSVLFADIDAIAPAGAINSNVIDMSKWIILHNNKGQYNGKQVISEKSLKQIHTPHMHSEKLIRLNPDQPLFSYGLGLAISVYQDIPYLMHSGTIDGFHALMIMVPQEKVGVIVLTNGQTYIADVLAYNIFERLLGLEHRDWNKKMRNLQDAKEKGLTGYLKKLEEERILDTTPSHNLGDYVGTYKNDGYGNMIIEKSGDNLVLKFNKFIIPLSHYHYDVFQSDVNTDFDGMVIPFNSNSKGVVDTLSIPFEPTVKDIVFKRVK